MRFWVYASASLLAGAGLVAYAFHTRQQFYPTVIYLVTSKVSVMVLCNVAFVLLLICGRIFKRIFLGSLRDAELEVRLCHHFGLLACLLTDLS
jgi:E3 ubiquitin-protein ligase synoviolin